MREHSRQEKQGHQKQATRGRWHGGLRLRLVSPCRATLSDILSLPYNMMSSPLTHFLDFTIANALHLAGILILAMICLKLLRGAANKLVKPASSQAKAGQQTAQQREAQTQALAD